MDAKQLCSTLGIPRRRLDALLSAGLPFEERGSKTQPWRFDLGAVARWLLERSEQPSATERLDPAQERARKDKVEREIRELALARERGELLDATATQEAWVATLSALRARLLAIPARCAPEAAQAASTAEATEAIRAELHAALEELADTEVVHPDDDESNDDDDDTE